MLMKTSEASDQPNKYIQHVTLDIGRTVFSTEIDDAGTYLYVGEALPDQATSDPVWRIARVVNASGSKKWADGNGNFDNVWDDRASLTYL